MTQPVSPLAPATSIRPMARPADLAAPAEAVQAPPVTEAQAQQAQDALQAAGLDLRVAPGEAGVDLGGLVAEDLLDPNQGVVGRGARPEVVQALQSSLNALGAEPPLATDGALGPRTTAAIRAFQEQVGLSPDGVAGSDTLRALQAQEALALAAAAEPPAAALPHLERAEALVGELREGQGEAMQAQLAQAQAQAYERLLASEGTEAATAAGQLAARATAGKPEGMAQWVQRFQDSPLAGEESAFAAGVAQALSPEALAAVAAANPGLMDTLDGMSWDAPFVDSPSSRFEAAQEAAETLPPSAEAAEAARVAAEQEAERQRQLDEIAGQPMP